MLTLTLFFVAALAADPTSITAVGPDADAAWKQGVESALTNLVLGPLIPEFTPAFLTKRMRTNRDDIVTSQRNHFRAHVARIMLNALCPDGLLHVQVPPEYAPEVVEAQVQELKDHSFSVRWLGKGPGGDFIVNVPRSVPPPSKE